jgi:hypothetical protein
MGNYELYIPFERPMRDTRGRFRKGHAPFNKGKRWDEYLTKFEQRCCSRGWANLEKYRKGCACAGSNRRAVVAILDDGTFVGRFESAAAARLAGTWARNINLCCQRQRKHAGKTADGRRLQWFYESDDEWPDLINNNE